MTDQEQEQFSTIVSGVAMLYKVEMQPPIIRMYWNSLKAHSLPDVEAALQKHIEDPKRGQFMPKPADIIFQICGDVKDQAALAWQLILENADPYASVQFPAPIMVAIERTFGSWGKFCTDSTTVPDKEWDWKRKEFIGNYEMAVRMNLKPNARYFTGTIEKNNRVRFPEWVPAVQIIGDDGRKQIASPDQVARELQDEIALIAESKSIQ